MTPGLSATATAYCSWRSEKSGLIAIAYRVYLKIVLEAITELGPD